MRKTLSEEHKRNISKSGIGKGRNPVVKGQRFGRLIVLKAGIRKISSGGTGKRYYYYAECACDCGGVATIMETSLRFGRVQSCGCLQRENIPRLPPGVAMANALYSNYRNRAKIDKMVFEINREYFLSLTKKNCYYCGKEPDCYYCGKEPAQIIKGKTGDYIYNGIDRKDPKEGYTVENTVPCCWMCNSMKKAIGFDEFLSQIARIYEHGVRAYSRPV